MSDVKPSSGGPPVFPAFDPLAPDQVGEPFALLTRARNECPVFYMPRYDLWCVTRMEDVLTVFRDTTTYSNSHEDVGRPPAEFADVIPDGHPVSHSLDTLDPPQHTRIRKLVQPAFTPRSLAPSEPTIRAICESLIDSFEDDGRADLVAAFTTHIPVRVIASIVGMEQADAPRLKEWTDDWFAIWLGDDPDDVRRERWRRTVDFDRYIRAFIESRRQAPRDDLTSTLILAATSDDEGQQSLSDSEIIAVIAGIVAAGSDTTSILLAHLVWLLLGERHRWTALLEDRRLVPQAIEETLRLRNPVRGLRRVTTCPAELDGAHIPAGAALYVHVGSANRDETVFEAADEFDPRRSNLSDHVGFGRWTHMCLGAPLARLEARVAMEVLLDRLPNLRLTRPDERLDYVANAVVPAVRQLPVEWH